MKGFGRSDEIYYHDTDNDNYGRTEFEDSGLLKSDTIENLIIACSEMIIFIYKKTYLFTRIRNKITRRFKKCDF